MTDEQLVTSTQLARRAHRHRLGFNLHATGAGAVIAELFSTRLPSGRTRVEELVLIEPDGTPCDEVEV